MNNWTTCPECGEPWEAHDLPGGAPSGGPEVAAPGAASGCSACAARRAIGTDTSLDGGALTSQSTVDEPTASSFLASAALAQGGPVVGCPPPQPANLAGSPPESPRAHPGAVTPPRGSALERGGAPGSSPASPLPGEAPLATSPGGPPASDASVGGYATVGPSSPDPGLNWQEGALVADRFRIQRFVGQGGMGKVFLAQDETLGRPIALKCVPQEIIFDGDARDDLRQEASRLLDLAHDNIVRIHTYYDGPTWPFFAMEYLEGPTLKALLRQRKQSGRAFELGEVLLIARQVARGLAHAHAKGIVHRDLKPGNLMLAAVPGESLGDSDVVKITDFGVSRVVADSTLRQTGRRSGTIPYMSPEQFRGETCTPRSDIYSFACTLYELLQGKPPFHTGDIGYQVLHKAPAQLAGVPRAVGDIILRALAKSPRERPADAGAFLSALEDACRGRRSIFHLRVPSRTSWTAAAAGLAVGSLLVAMSSSFWQRPAAPREVGASPAARVPAGTSSPAQQPELEAFVKKLRDELTRQIPSLIGRNFPGATRSNRADAVTFSFRMPEPSSSNLQRGLLDRLVLLVTGEQAHEARRLLKGTANENGKTFELEDLKDGVYAVRAYLDRAGTSAGQGTEPLLEEPHKFRIDLTPPSFEVVPVQPEALIDPNPPLRQTFYETVDFTLVSARDPADIAEAYVALALGDVTRPWERLTKLPTWRIELPPGVTTTYRVYTLDLAGNRSAALEVSVRRLRLDVESFGLALPEGVAGNLATVTGVLRVEGDQSPTLKYFIKDQLVEPESTGVGPLDAEFSTGGLLRDPGGIPFSAVLRLPSATNTIEVRYAWRDNPPERFARPMRITDVKVRPPRLSMDPPARRTAESALKLAGTLEPHFEGLELSLERKGQGSQRVDLFPNPNSDTASFSQEVKLLEGENTFLITFFYKKSPILATQQAFSIFCDHTPPTLDAPVEFEPLGDLLYVTIRPSEELDVLRMEEVYQSGKASAWRVLEKDPGAQAYTAILPIPIVPLTLRLELTDRAGLVGRSEHLCPITRADLESGRVARRTGSSSKYSPGLAPAAAHSGEEDSVTPAVVGGGAGVILIASPFVRQSGLEFVPFGADRREIARTEVPEPVWRHFLEERGHGYHGKGQPTQPMVLEGFPPDLLRDFVKWFEEKARDGYAYSIPSKEDWLCAFAGVSDLTRAREIITEWFRGKGPSAQRFDPSPQKPYGSGEVSEIASRAETKTPSSLYDMEANVEEVVEDNGELKTIGGSNQDARPDVLLEKCLEPRPLGAAARTLEGRWAGLRLVRRPLLSSNQRK